MQIIAHRINTLAQLQEVPLNFGIELDLRYRDNDLILHHDPFTSTQQETKFIELLQNYRCVGPMILNTKSEGLELRCIELMKQFKIENWFFLDLSMPYFVCYANAASNLSIEGFTVENLAVRFSEEEPIEYALSFAKKAGWVWVDCFSKMPLDDESYLNLKNAGFKLCLVSPELQKHDKSRIAEFRNQLGSKKIDAVCTKHPELWS